MPSVQDPSAADVVGRRVFWLGTLLFLVVKMGLVLAFTIPSGGTPRLGDDAVLYAWEGRKTLSGVDGSAPALQEMRSLLQLQDQPSPKVINLRLKIYLQADNLHFSPYRLLLGFLVGRGISIKWSYAVLELITAACLTVGLALFSRGLFGVGPAGLAMVLLSGARFPNHGLVDMAPAVMELALVLILCARSLEGTGGGLLDLMVALVAAATHELSKLYLWAALALGALWPGWGTGGARRAVRHLLILLAAIAAGWTVLRTRLPAVDPDTLKWCYGIIGPSSVAKNWGGVPPFVAEMWKANWVVLLLSLAGVRLFPRRMANRRVLYCLALVLGALAVSLLHRFPTGQAELFSRVLTPLGILACGMAGAALWEASWALPRPLAFVMAALVGLYSLNSVRAGGWDMFTRMNSKAGVLHDAVLAERIAELPAGTPVLYLENYFVMMAALVHGAWRLPAIPWPMLADSSSAERVLRERPPAVVVTTSFRWLNTSALLNRRGLARHEFGFHFDDFDRLTLQGEGVGGKDLSVLMENLGAETAVSVEGQGPCPVLSLPAKSLRWSVIPASCVRKGPVRLALPKHPAWIRGVRDSAAPDRVHWPWGSRSFVVSGRLRDFELLRRWHKDTEVSFDFSWDGLFRQAGAEGALPSLRRPLEAMSDDSGLVFVRTGAFRPPSGGPL